MSQSEIKRLKQILAKLVRKQLAQEKRIGKIDKPPLDRSTLAKLKILRLELQRIKQEIHMHEREIERLRGQRGGV